MTPDSSPLVAPADLFALMERSGAPLLLDVRWNLGANTGREEYLAGHLPGAVWVDLDGDLAGAPGDGGRHPLPTPAAFNAAMRRVGVTADRPVVVYDGAHGMAAARLWWLLTDGGKADVSVLNGGYAAWLEARLPVETGDITATPGDISLSPGGRPLVSAAQVGERSTTLWDVRAAERYRGDVEPIDPVAGHIPGARNLPVAGFTGPHGFAPAEVLRQYFAELEPGDIVSCGSGVTAAAGILAAESVGIHGVALYPGSWSEWIRDPQRPIETGPEKAATGA